MEHVTIKRSVWRNPRWLAALAFLIFSVAFSIFVVIASKAATDGARAIKKANETNAVVNSIKQNQLSLDELVGFIHQIEASSSQGQSDTVTKIFALLCATTDPTRLATCQALGIPTPGGG